MRHPPFGRASIGPYRAYFKPPVELVVGDLEDMPFTPALLPLTLISKKCENLCYNLLSKAVSDSGDWKRRGQAC